MLVGWEEGRGIGIVMLVGMICGGRGFGFVWRGGVVVWEGWCG